MELLLPIDWVVLRLSVPRMKTVTVVSPFIVCDTGAEATAKAGDANSRGAADGSVIVRSLQAAKRAVSKRAADAVTRGVVRIIYVWSRERVSEKSRRVLMDLAKTTSVVERPAR